MNWLLIILCTIVSFAIFVVCVLLPSEKETENIETVDANKKENLNEDFIYKAAVLLVGKTFYDDLKIFGANDFGEIAGVIIGDTLIILAVFFVINKIMEVLNIFNQNAASRREKAFMAAAVLNFIMSVYSKI